MKTQIIQLSQNDDYLSVRDKMSWGQTGRILLIWPVHGRILYRQLDLNLVKRHAATMGAQLALVTHDSEVRFYARQIGIPVFSNIPHAQDYDWEVRQRVKIDLDQNFQQRNLDKIRNKIHPPAPAWKLHSVIRFLCLGISVLALLILAIFILPGAKIILSPQVEIQSMRLDLSADPSATTINFSTGSLPTYSQEIILEGHDTKTSTGSMIFPDEPAMGNLKFTNISKQVINIPSGTIVTTLGSDPIRFITSTIDDVTVNPNKSVVVAARAIKPGPSGNLLSNKLVAIEGNLELNLKVTNPDATQGGTDASVPSPATQDLQFVRDRLRGQLKQTALTEMQSILPAEDTLLSPTISIIETLEETYIPSIGEPGNQLELTMRLRFKSQVVSGDMLRSLVVPILDSNTPVGYTPVMNSLVITQLSDPALAKDGNTRWTVSVIRKLQVIIRANQVFVIVNGMTVAKAKEQLSSSLPLMDQPQIILTPSWWPRLPFLTMRIKVTQAENP